MSVGICTLEILRNFLETRCLRCLAAFDFVKFRYIWREGVHHKDGFWKNLQEYEYLRI